MQPGRRVDDRVEITAGLDAGATVAVRGGGLLNEGDLVRVANDTADSKPKQAPAPARKRQQLANKEHLHECLYLVDQNPIPALMLFVLLTFGGLIAFNAMKVQNFPDIPMPTISVTVSLPGASPTQLENDVARKVENSIATLQGLKHIYTKVQDGGATITAEFRLEKPTQEALDDVRSAVARVRADLPGDVRDPIITKMDLAAQPVLAFTVASPRMDDEALSWFVDNDVGQEAAHRARRGRREPRGRGGSAGACGARSAQAAGAGRPAADVSRQLRLVQTESAGGRTDLGGSEQPCARWPRCRPPKSWRA